MNDKEKNDFFESLFEKEKRYYGGIIVCVKGSSAQIEHPEITVQILALPTNFIFPRRPNLEAIFNQKKKLSFFIEINTKKEGLIAKNIKFDN